MLLSSIFWFKWYLPHCFIYYYPTSLPYVSATARFRLLAPLLLIKLKCWRKRDSFQLFYTCTHFLGYSFYINSCRNGTNFRWKFLSETSQKRSIFRTFLLMKKSLFLYFLLVFEVNTKGLATLCTSLIHSRCREYLTFITPRLNV